MRSSVTTATRILQRLRQVKPSSSFRSGYSYSNFGLTAGAVAVAKAFGMSCEDAADAKLYKPLGMSSTSSRYADFLTRTNRATLHAQLDGKWRALAKRDPDAQSPAGGVSSNARDLAQWMRLQLGNGKYNGKQLIKEDAIGSTHVPLMPLGKNPVSGTPVFYGLGWNVDYGKYGEVWGHAGAFSVAHALWSVSFHPKASASSYSRMRSRPAFQMALPMRSSTWS
ncbi:beta-lactamase family protein (plasmid) [Phyllobacterium sp. A18/5-2]|uniref:serine hydrolase domain-containing protein n=1 Tax=Phyllobacterium sp. A18/5-2 TaxID=2978392 RepID=UPI0021C61648|nr:serine hydrolase domain-containing protein [Phyllobacterium sp. A18/5-2]UXN66557.1 beta-lactamase family protein [Phyllobacterium sp. A18/5-2]